MITREQFFKDSPLIVAAAIMVTAVLLSNSMYFALLGAGYGVFLLYKTKDN